MEETVLKATHRDVLGKHVNALRREGKLPAVVYGRRISPIPIALDYREASRILPGITSSHLITIDIEGSQHRTLVREKQRHPVLGNILHVDFLAVSMTEKLRAQVMIELVGDSPAAKELGGVLVNGQEQVEVECLPNDLPEKIVIDVSKLAKIGDAIHVRDIEPPTNVAILTDGNEMIVLVTAPVAEEVTIVAPTEAGAEEPEVIEKGKKEEEDI